MILKGGTCYGILETFLFDEEGAELIQFALVIAIVAVLAIAIQGL